MKRFEFLGNEYTFKRIKMLELIKMEDKLKDQMKDAEPGEGQLLQAGGLVEEFLDGFDKKEMLDAEIDDFYLVQGLHLLFTYCKHNRSDADIQQLKNKIIDAAIEGQLILLSQGAEELSDEQFPEEAESKPE